MRRIKTNGAQRTPGHAPARELLPELAPAEPVERVPAVEEPSRVERIAVYAMNATVLIFSAPIGLALLVMNVVGGANFRTTAHAMALTGIATTIPLI